MAKSGLYASRDVDLKGRLDIWDQNVSPNVASAAGARGAAAADDASRPETAAQTVARQPVPSSLNMAATPSSLQGGMSASPDAMAAQANAIAGSMMKGGTLSHFDTQLSALYLQHSEMAEQTAAFANSVRQFDDTIHMVDGRQYVTVDVTAADGDGAALLAQLNALGGDTFRYGAAYGSMASGQIATDQLGQLAGLSNLGFARESGFMTSVGLVTTQAEVAQHNDTARTTFSVDGSGLTIGVLSDSFATRASPATTMAQDIANDDLPVATTVLADTAGGTDEGRGMAQLIHDLAPGAAIDFATGYGGQAAFAANINALVTAGADIIVDDLIYFAELAYQNGPIA